MTVRQHKLQISDSATRTYFIRKRKDNNSRVDQVRKICLSVHGVITNSIFVSLSTKRFEVH